MRGQLRLLLRLQTLFGNSHHTSRITWPVKFSNTRTCSTPSNYHACFFAHSYGVLGENCRKCHCFFIKEDCLVATFLWAKLPRALFVALNATFSQHRDRSSHLSKLICLLHLCSAGQAAEPITWLFFSCSGKCFDILCWINKRRMLNFCRSCQFFQTFAIRANAPVTFFQRLPCCAEHAVVRRWSHASEK